jgi:hypothetical protein
MYILESWTTVFQKTSISTVHMHILAVHAHAAWVWKFFSVHVMHDIASPYSVELTHPKYEEGHQLVASSVIHAM